MTKRIMCPLCHGNGWLWTPKREKVSINSYPLPAEVAELVKVECLHCSGKGYAEKKDTEE